MTKAKDRKYSLLIFPILISAVCLFAINLFPAFAQENLTNERKVVITGILINGIAVNESLFNSLVIAKDDSIVVNYNCTVSQPDESPFIFQVNLASTNGQSDKRTYNKTSLYYKGLNESNYTLIIGAFGKDWKAEPSIIKFQVNNSKAEEFKMKLKSQAKDTVEPKANIKPDTTLSDEKNKKSELDISTIIIGIVIGILSITIIVLFVALGNKNKFEKKGNTKSKGKTNMGNGQSKTLNRDDIDKIILENSNLRAEIAALRGQIDAMQTRAEDLKNQNNILKEQVDKLSISQKEVLDLQQQKDDLFAVIIHDIKNPAALIKSLVDLLRSYDLTATEQQEVIDDIMESTKKIVALSQEVTRILSLEGTTLQLSLHPTDINEIVTVVHRRNKIAAENKSIEMSLETQSGIPDSLMDATKIDEVLDNLTSNAIKFSHKGGQVKIKTKFENNVIFIEVSDNGLGLSKEDIQKAFQKGSKLSARPTGTESSSGFGLWIVKKLIEAHGGNVEVKSTLGIGSTFSVELPYIDIEKKEIRKFVNTED